MRNSRALIAFVVASAFLLSHAASQAANFKNWCMISEDGFPDRTSAVVFKDVIFMAQPGTAGFRSSDGMHWETLPTPWNSLDDIKLVVFKHSLWAIGAGDQDKLLIWRSDDGMSWTEYSGATPPARMYFAIATFQDKLWISGGWDDYNSRCLDDIWSSDDGSSWTLVARGEQVAWTVRCDHVSFEFNNKLWIAGGSFWAEEDEEYYYWLDCTGFDDVWSSPDGRNWIKESNLGLGRGGLSVTVHDGLIYLFGGELERYEYWEEYMSGDDGDHWTTIDSFVCSPDGRNWTSLPSSPVGPIQNQSSVFLNGRFYLIGGGNWIWASPNGIDDAAAAPNPATFKLPMRGLHDISLRIKNTGTSTWSGISGTGLKGLRSGNKMSVPGFVGLEPSDTVKPGETRQITVRVDTTNCWSNQKLVLQMYQPGIGTFGDPVVILVEIAFDHPISWHRVDHEEFSIKNSYDANTAVAASDKYLWVQNWRSPDGMNWLKTVGGKNSPWGYWSQYGYYSGYFSGSYIWFNKKLTALNEDNIQTSADGMSWSRSEAPWKILEYESRDYWPIVSSCCVLNGKLYAMISYDVDTEESYKNKVWSSSTGGSWSKVGEFKSLSSCGKMVAFQGKLWIFGGTEQYLHEPGSYREEIVRDTYSSTNGADWKMTGNVSYNMDPVKHAVVYHDKIWSVSQNGTVAVSTNGTDWQPTNRFTDGGIEDLYGMAVFDDKIWVASGDGIWCGTVNNRCAMVSKSILDFARCKVLTGATPAQTVTVYSTGQSQLGFTGAGAQIVSSRPGEFVFATAPNLSPVANARSINVAFNPSRIGPTSATLRITTADPVNPVIDVKLIGEGVSTQPLRSGNIITYLLGVSSDKTGLDFNADGKVDISDHVRMQNSPIHVTSPTLASVKYLGNPSTVTWKTDTPIGNVKLELARNHAAFRTITNSTPNDGSHTWTIPSDVIPDSNYSVIVTDAAHANVQGESPFFAIASPNASLAARYPDGGESFKRGAKVPVNWKCSMDSIVEHVRVDLYRNERYYKTLASSRSLDEGDVYVWTISSDFATGSNFRIVIIDADHPNTRAASPGTFSITQ